MKEYTIYTCGKMSGLTLQEQMWWRLKAESAIRKAAHGSRLTFVHPPFFYNYEEENHRSQREIKEWELGVLRDRCDIVVVNLDGINESIGAHYELAVLDTIDRFIPVIAFGNPKEVHPWILDSILRIEDTLDSVADYIATYCLL